jgi:hypothetical protein
MRGTLFWLFTKKISRPSLGEDILFFQPYYGYLLKKICEKKGYEFLVRGNHPLSSGSEVFGLIKPQQIYGKVIWHLARK